MKFRTALLLTLVFISLSAPAQNLFQKGYIVNEDNQKIECLIKNEGWVDNPSEIKYKLTESGEVLTASLKDTKEFGIGQSRFVRKTVDLDYSSNEADELSTVKEPEFKEETIFLRYLVDGEASLFAYKSSDLKRFFMSMNNEEPVPLVYKLYNASTSPSEKQILSNTGFRRQLMQNIICGDVTIQRLTEIRYRNLELIKVFSEYNACKGGEYVTYKNQEGGKIKLNIAIRPGVRFTNFETERSSVGSPTQGSFDPETSIRIGTEFEFSLPGNNNKWAILLEPVYQKYEATGPREREWSVTRTEAKISYQSIEVSAGMRYYLILSQSSRLFFNILLTVDKPLGDSFVSTSNTFEINSGLSSNIGVGYRYSDRYFIEIRQGMKRDLLTDWGIGNKYTFTSIVLGVRVF